MIQSASLLITALSDPVALLWMFSIAAMVWTLLKRNWTALALSFLCFAFLQITAGTSLSRRLIAQLEAPYDPSRKPLQEKADAVLMLGGTLAFGPRELLQINLGEASDRILTAAELVREGRAKVLVLCSAPMTVNGEIRPDSELISRWLERWNPRFGDIVRLPIGHNTAEEASAVADLAAKRGWKKILLVTSAFHLRRAEATLRKAGVAQIIPVGCDFQGVFPGDSEYEWIGIPRVHSLLILKLWIHEQIGWIYYGFRGWR